MLSCLKQDLLTQEAARQFHAYFIEEVAKLLNHSKSNVELKQKRLKDIEDAIEKL